MKNIFKLNYLLFAVLTLFVFTACEEDEAAPEEENEVEVFTDVKLVFTPAGGGASVEAAAQDPDPKAQAWADKNEVAIEAFREAGAGSYIDASYGYAIFPSIGKIGLLVGGAQGKGMVYQEGKPIGKATMTQVSLGFQFGGQVYKQIIFFEDARSMREFTSGNFEFSGQAAAIALNSGASAELSTGGGGRT